MTIVQQRKQASLAAIVLIVSLVVLTLTACSSTTVDSADGASTAPAATATRTPSDALSEPTPDIEPQPFVPSGPVGTAEGYDSLIERLKDEIGDPSVSIPWPDLRNPDPVVAQQDMFDFWVWMEANLPEPILIDALAVPDSPTRDHIASLFGSLKNDNELRVRPQDPYRSFNHQAITFESAGLPLWLRRGVPEPAVVIFYDDESGPSELRDRDSGETTSRMPGTAPRSWVAIMVETDVGWLMWSDTPLDGSDLEVPDLSRPDPSAERDRTDL